MKQALEVYDIYDLFGDVNVDTRDAVFTKLSTVATWGDKNTVTLVDGALLEPILLQAGIKPPDDLKTTLVAINA